MSPELEPLTPAVYLDAFPKPSENFIHRELACWHRQRPGLRIVCGRNLRRDRVDRVDGSDALRAIPVDALNPRAAASLLRHGSLPLRHPRIWRDLWRSDFPPRRCHQAALLARCLLARRVHWLHAHFLSEPAEAAFLATRALAIPLTVSAHGSDVWAPPPASRDRLRAVVEYASLVLCCSRRGQEDLQERYPDYAERIVLNHHGVMPPPMAPGSGGGETGAPFRLAAAGRLVEKKGFATLLHAVAMAKQRGVAVRLTLCGEGPERPALDVLRRELGLEREVELRPFLPYADWIAVAAGADAVVIPSLDQASDGDRDGIPNVLLEAMATGALVISTPHHGALEVLQGTGAAFLAEDFSAKSLAWAIAQAWAARGRWPAARQEARRIVLLHFDAGRQAQRALRLLEDSVRLSLKPDRLRL
ncbi:MAG: glycosyltransferase [Sumerlaeia bacterium]